MEFNWVCPFCDHHSVITDSVYRSDDFYFGIPNSEGCRYIKSIFIVCPNPKCKRFTFAVQMAEAKVSAGKWLRGKPIKQWELIPPSRAVTFPNYVPKPILDDYEEACLIQNLSPKASATLSRRCLQGMIRDFWNIKKGRLIDEIKALEAVVDPLTWKAIDTVRKVGNIGAHMELDINLIIDVGPDEAAKLIELIELLIRDWYITRHERQERLEQIVAIAEAKVEAKKGAVPAEAAEESAGDAPPAFNTGEPVR